MKQVFLYSILFIFLTFTKEKILYKSNTNYNKHCDTIEDFISDYSSQQISWEYAINAEYCRLKEPDNGGGNNDGDNTNPSSIIIRNLKDKHIDKDICCYISILDSSDNWNYFCGKISPSNYNDSRILEYINELKENNFKNDFKDIKIDCFSKKLDFMINIFIISLIYLI